MIELNKVYLGDNWTVMGNIPNAFVDFIYFDSPFATGNDFYTTDKQLAYSDKYILMTLLNNLLIPRIQQSHRILKKTGNFCLHGDYRFIHYVKVQCDHIFGVDNFRNEIIWCYDTSGRTDKTFNYKHDTILWYSKSDEYIFNPIKLEYKNNHMPVITENGKQYYTKRDTKTNKIYKYEVGKNKIPNDYWTDIPSVNTQSKERTVYPTQKPKALLERLILSLTTRDGIVFDPFCGSGTSLVVAKEHHRKYIGVDQSPIAIEVTNQRLSETHVKTQITDFMGNKT